MFLLKSIRLPKALDCNATTTTSTTNTTTTTRNTTRGNNFSSTKCTSQASGSTLMLLTLFIMLNFVNFSSTLSVSNFAKPNSVQSDEKELAETATSFTVDDNSHQSQLVKRSAPKQYNFGLGKRNNGESDLEVDPIVSPLVVKNLLFNRDRVLDMLRNMKGFSIEEQPTGFYGVKRSMPQRFSFGIGKRAMEEVGDEDLYTDDKNEDLFEKRKVQRYQFGIGKRSEYGSDRKVSNFEDFMKRRYSFGLGKRSSDNV